MRSAGTSSTEQSSHHSSEGEHTDEGSVSSQAEDAVEEGRASVRSAGGAPEHVGDIAARLGCMVATPLRHLSDKCSEVEESQDEVAKSLAAALAVHAPASGVALTRVGDVPRQAAASSAPPDRTSQAEPSGAKALLSRLDAFFSRQRSASADAPPQEPSSPGPHPDAQQAVEEEQSQQSAREPPAPFNAASSTVGDAAAFLLSQRASIEDILRRASAVHERHAALTAQSARLAAGSAALRAVCAEYVAEKQAAAAAEAAADERLQASLVRVG